MQISKLAFYVWRHSLRKINEYPFFECLDMESVRELTLESLKNEEIAIWMDKLLNRKAGYHSQLLKTGNISGVIRQLNYVSQILMSTVIKNDIGLHGGLSPIFDNIDRKESVGDFRYASKLPSEVVFANIDSNNFSPFSLIDLRRNRGDYIVPYSTNLHNVDIFDGLADKIKLISEEIIDRLIERKEMTTDCEFVAIDFFICKGDVIPFECHFPGRGIGVHIFPFLLAKETMGMAQSVIEDIKKQLEGFYGSKVTIDIRNAGTTTFHELDRIIVSLLSCKSSIIRKSIDLDVCEDLSNFQMRDFEMKNELYQKVIDSPISNYDLDEIRALLGNWVILKTRMNTPWWSKSRKRPEIQLVDDKLISRVNYLFKRHGEIILQKLITDSLDINGHFGELRTYYLLVR